MAEPGEETQFRKPGCLYAKAIPWPRLASFLYLDPKVFSEMP